MISKKYRQRLSRSPVKFKPLELCSKRGYTIKEICITAEKWFASGESNVFCLSREDVSGLS
jgi:hypothetical protein